MAENELIQLFGEQKVRTKWDDEKGNGDKL